MKTRNQKVRKQKIRERMWAVLVWGKVNNVYHFRHEAKAKRDEMTEDCYHCSTCECEGLDKSEVKIVPIEITYSLPTKSKNK